jgi:hypothetical protein
MGFSRADRDLVRQHCAQCLTEVFTSGYETPNGETLCGSCYFALWGPRANGNKVASTARGRPRRLNGDRPISIQGSPRFLEPVAAEQRGLLRR